MPSRLRFGAWWVTGGRTPIALRLRNGLRIRLRGLRTTDYGVAVDVFHNECYRSPRPLADTPRRIVDLGSNVGFSVLYWLLVAPDAEILAFEPHPAHVAALDANLALNGVRRGVDVRACAVGTRAGSARLSDRGSSSSIVDAVDGLTVPVVDFYASVAGPVDILKVDIEGVEYELLDDPRLSRLAPRALVVEWHGAGGFDRLRHRLDGAGYDVEKTADGPHQTGLLWAYRR